MSATATLGTGEDHASAFEAHAKAQAGAPSGAQVEEPSPMAAASAAAGLPPLEKVVIAIHGIGNQRRSDTIRSVARRFGAYDTSADPPLPVLPLGFFHIGNLGKVQVSRLNVPPQSPLAGIGFAEVFWADIPRKVAQEADTLEDTRAWGATVVSRAHCTYLRKVNASERRLDHIDFNLCASVIDEVVEAIRVMENLLAVFEKMGIFKFELAPLLRDYIDDVQLVTEFKYHRDQILRRFHAAMTQILTHCQDMDRELRAGAAGHAERAVGGHAHGGAPVQPPKLPEIYIVAHSEGTVISFLAILQALSGVLPADTKANGHINTDWVKQLRGFMTIGSPIDKHLALWESMWQGLDLASEMDGDEVVFRRADQSERLRLPGKIAWRNYYDRGDPIGFQLDTARTFLNDEHRCAAFDFKEEDDIGFCRYLLPGKAHNDYWGDGELFGHFIGDVVLPDMREIARKPQDKPWVGRVSAALPYLLALALGVLAAFLLFKGTTPPRPQRFSVLDTLGGVLLLGLLMTCVTAAARIPRLVKTARVPWRLHPEGWRWHVLALMVFSLGASLAAALLPTGFAAFLGRPLVSLLSLPWTAEDTGKTFLLASAAVTAFSGWIVPRGPDQGRNALLACGSVTVLTLLLAQATSHAQADLWPLMLAGAAFLYLWWLQILLFDLAFIWHRYIREAVAVRVVNKWHEGKDAQPDVTLRNCMQSRKARPAPAPHADEMVVFPRAKL